MTRKIRARLSTLRPLACALLVVGLGSALIAQEPPPPGTETAPSLQASEDSVETDPSYSPGGPNLAEEAEEAPGGIGSEVDLSEIPTARELGSAPADPDAPPRSHIQGELEQSRALETRSEAIDLLTGRSLVSEESSPPSVEGDGAAAPGDTVTSFGGLGYTGWIPPDTIHAVGPNHIVMAVNSGFAVYSKLGTELRSYTSFSSFLNKPSGWAGTMFDPRILYDTNTGRYVMLVLGKDDTNKRSYVWTASTDDPTGSWWRVRFNVTRNQDSADEAWLDYAGLGVDENGLYWTGNYFKWSGGFDTAVIRTANTDLVDGTGTGAGYIHTSLTWPSGGNAASLQPAHPHSLNADDEMFFVNTFSGSGSKILLWRRSGDRYSGQGLGSRSLTRNEISVATYNAIGGNVDQGDSSTDIDGGDARVLNAIYQNRRVYATLTDDVNNDGTATGAYTMKLNTNDNTLVDHDLLWTTDTYRFYPAVTVNASGISQDPEIAVYYNWVDPDATGSTKYVSAARKIYTNFPTSTGSDFVFKLGEDSYVRKDSKNRNRWGDYSGAAYDFTCDAVSGSLEYAGTSDTWKTWIRTDEIGNGKCPQIEVTSPNGTEVWTAGTTKTITWKSTDLTSTDHDIFVFFKDGSITTQIAGPLSSFATSFTWDVPFEATSDGEIFVGNFNNSTGFYEVSDWSDDPFEIVLPNDYTLNSETVTGTDLFQACSSIIIGPDVTFSSTSDTTFKAPQVEVRDNVLWETGSTSVISIEDCP